MMLYSKTRIDKAGYRLCKGDHSVDEDDNVIDWWREQHIAPLTDVTMKLIEWLSDLDYDIHVNQRLKRKPQIINKLSRSSNRLTQMHDLGGCRAIFKDNKQLDDAEKIIKKKIMKSKYFKIAKIIDYRENGREESGYRALHIIVCRKKHYVEIQFRTVSQHSWAEAIERTSVLCNSALKSGQGPEELIEFFKITSDAFYDIECKRRINDELIYKLKETEGQIKILINSFPKMVKGGKEMNGKFMKAMIEREKKRTRKINNWILIFNWQEGVFVHWIEAEFVLSAVSKEYSDTERNFSYEDGYEVVLIGSSKVESIQETHSHYFGVESYEEILKFIHQRVDSYRNGLSEDAYNVLQKLCTHGRWGTNSVSFDTLQKHYLNIEDREKTKEAIELLKEKGLIAGGNINSGISILPEKRGEIEQILGRVK